MRLTVEDGVEIVRLDRPPVNALNRAIREDLLAVAETLSAREDVRAFVVHGGPRTFAAGADVRDQIDLRNPGLAEEARRISASLGALATVPKPSVSAITGFALGGGLEIAVSTDRRIAADNAKLGVPEILLGVIPGGGGTQRLARLVGEAAAKDLVYTGRFVGAAEALAMGLVDEVVPAAEVFARALTYARQFTEGPALAYAAAKKAIEGGLDTDLRAGLDLESEVFAALFDTEDQTIGMTSFLENGPGKAKFTGR
ncbi:enoyl-CoA hydratase/isomerase family protein [Amycolatopsis sp. NPDC051903]|uniref:enoyl-CoA hydratase/isomerase family protein n=1 Tax=Amycolatopsis sp. NPDC051903 TaxID=3363936 RepID=UPI00378EBDDB